MSTVTRPPGTILAPLSKSAARRIDDRNNRPPIADGEFVPVTFKNRENSMEFIVGALRLFN